jgi:hypothetical protein
MKKGGQNSLPTLRNLPSLNRNLPFGFDHIPSRDALCWQIERLFRHLKRMMTGIHLVHQDILGVTIHNMPY